MSRPKARDQKLGFRNQGVELTTEDRSPEPSLIQSRPLREYKMPPWGSKLQVRELTG